MIFNHCSGKRLIPEKLPGSFRYLYEYGIKSAKKLHQLTGIPLSTIYDHLKQFQTVKAGKVGSGRPPKLNANDRRRVAQLANFHEKWSATRMVAQKANVKGSTLVSRQTICRVLKE
jgi:transposase